MTPLKDMLKKVRTRKSMSQETLSRKAGFKRQEYSCYELGKWKPSWDRMVAIADALDVSLDYLADRKEWTRFN